MIHFRCKYCGQKIRIQEVHAGRKAKCPKCKNIIVIPKPKVEDIIPTTTQSISSDSKVSSKNTDFDLSFLDVSQNSKVPSQPVAPDSAAVKTIDDLQKLQESMGIGRVEPEPAPKRKLPWFIDIFLYPTSAPGLIILAIIIVIPLLIGIAAMLLGPFGFFVAIPGFVINIVILLYMYWYYCECIRDSADGNLRAPDVLVNAPGIGDMFFQMIKLVACLAAFLLPALIYFLHTKKSDTTFWLLSGCAAFFFPMGLLAVIMFDSFSGLNPLLLIGSIFSTFFQYCGLLLLFCTFGGLVALIALSLPQSWILRYLSKAINIYLLLIAAHLLGRFYWRYQEKLNWEV